MPGARVGPCMCCPYLLAGQGCHGMDQAAAWWAGQRCQASDGNGQGCWPLWKQEQDLAVWLCCHGVSREMILPRIIREDGPVLFSVPDGWDGEGGERVPVRSGHCWSHARLYSLSPGCLGAVSGCGAWQYSCCLPWRAWGDSQPFSAAHRSLCLTAASFSRWGCLRTGGNGCRHLPPGTGPCL